MPKLSWKPGTMIYPLPAIMASVGDFENKKDMNIITLAWTGTICSDPAMCYISVRPQRHSYHIIKKYGNFVINVTTEQTAWATDYCGVKSGKDIDKFKEAKLTPEKSNFICAPSIAECPVSIECEVKEIVPLGSHDMFIANVLAVNVDPQYMDETGRFCLDKASPIAYSHGQYYGLGKHIGKFGHSVQKKKVYKKRK